MYHNLEEVEGLRWVYSLSAAVAGPSDYLLTLAERLQEGSRNLLEEIGPIEERLQGRSYYRPDSLIATLQRRGAATAPSGGRK